MSIQLQEQVKSLLYQLAEAKRTIDDLSERVSVLERKVAEFKKPGRPPLVRDNAQTN